jgi:hypothetical protein
VLGPDDLDTLETAYDYATMLYRAKRFQDSKLLFRRVLEGRVAMLGPEHDLTIDVAAALKAISSIEDEEAGIVNVDNEYADDILDEDYIEENGDQYDNRRRDDNNSSAYYQDSSSRSYREGADLSEFAPNESTGSGITIMRADQSQSEIGGRRSSGDAEYYATNMGTELDTNDSHQQGRDPESSTEQQQKQQKQQPPRSYSSNFEYQYENKDDKGHSGYNISL